MDAVAKTFRVSKIKLLKQQRNRDKNSWAGKILREDGRKVKLI